MARCVQHPGVILGDRGCHLCNGIQFPIPQGTDVRPLRENGRLSRQVTQSDRAVTIHPTVRRSTWQEPVFKDGMEFTGRGWRKVRRRDPLDHRTDPMRSRMIFITQKGLDYLEQTDPLREHPS